MGFQLMDYDSDGHSSIALEVEGCQVVSMFSLLLSRLTLYCKNFLPFNAFPREIPSVRYLHSRK